MDTNQNQDISSQQYTASIHSRVDQDAKTHHAITIGKEPLEVYNFFRNFKNLPLFMKDLKSIDVLSEKKSHWTVQIKTGQKVEWDAVITQEIPGKLISWTSVEGSEVMTSGTVRFEKAPADYGTVVSLAMDYSVPGGKLTEFILVFTGETPEFLIQTNLKRLKALLETGEIPTVEGQPSGRDDDAETLKH